VNGEDGKGRGSLGEGGDETPPLLAALIHISRYVPALSNKKLNYRREAAGCLVLLSILVSR